MSEKLEDILNAARRLPIAQQRQLAEQLLQSSRQAELSARPGDARAGSIRRHFGTWDSGDTRSADNERIDHDLALEYGGANHGEE